MDTYASPSFTFLPDLGSAELPEVTDLYDLVFWMHPKKSVSVDWFIPKIEPEVADEFIPHQSWFLHG
jgi:hypothetical protein